MCDCSPTRLDSKENCDKTIEVLNGSTLPDSSEPLMVKFADSSSNKKRQQTAGGCGLLSVATVVISLSLRSLEGHWRGSVVCVYMSTQHLCVSLAVHV